MNPYRTEATKPEEKDENYFNEIEFDFSMLEASFKFGTASSHVTMIKTFHPPEFKHLYDRDEYLYLRNGVTQFKHFIEESKKNGFFVIDKGEILTVFNWDAFFSANILSIEHNLKKVRVAKRDRRQL